jgi:hypothetical protein
MRPLAARSTDARLRAAAFIDLDRVESLRLARVIVTRR